MLATKSRAHWQAKLDAAGVPSAPVRATAEVLEHEQTIALEILQSLPGDSLRRVGMPLRFDGERPPLRSTAPSLGQHDTEVETKFRRGEPGTADQDLPGLPGPRDSGYLNQRRRRSRMRKSRVTALAVGGRSA